ncbi:hypothetical protein ACOSQ2_020855 [Xanthoceras sorbifolium]
MLLWILMVICPFMVELDSAGVVDIVRSRISALSGVGLYTDRIIDKLEIPSFNSLVPRERADKLVFGEQTWKGKIRIFKEDEERRRNRVLNKTLLRDALEKEEEEYEVKKEDQKSLSVGIIGAPNAGMSTLTNFMVGTKVAVVSWKTNTSTHEVLRVMTKGETQILLTGNASRVARLLSFPLLELMQGGLM